MNRSDIEKEFDVENGIIRSPGKFEGCTVYMPYFWDTYMNGMSNDEYEHASNCDCDSADRSVCANEILISSVDVDASDRTMFPELNNRTVVKFFETEQGFVTEL